MRPPPPTRHLSNIERSPNTVKAYAHDLKDDWSFLDSRELDWREVRLEDVGEFVAWLRLPPSARDGRVALLPTAQAHVGAATVNRKLSAVAAFYVHLARNGVSVGELLTTWAPGRRGGWKPFLHHVSKGRPHQRRLIGLRAPKKLPRVLTVAEMQAILDGCVRLRDRFLWALLCEIGMRIGEALGLRHEDIDPAACQVSVVPRPNANGARVKSGRPRTVPVRPAVVRLYADYLNTEYGDLDSDYVFVNLFAQQRGEAWSYPAVYELVLRLRRNTGIDFDPHWMRHTAATRWQMTECQPRWSRSSSDTPASPPRCPSTGTEPDRARSWLCRAVLLAALAVGRVQRGGEPGVPLTTQDTSVRAGRVCAYGSTEVEGSSSRLVRLGCAALSHPAQASACPPRTHRASRRAATVARGPSEAEGRVACA